MKTAKEMFEELGYELVQDDCRAIDYEKGTVHITFLNNKSFSAWEDLGYGAGSTEKIITLDELKAINKQIEELKWNE